MDADTLFVLLIFPGLFIFLSLIFFFTEPSHIKERAALPLLALLLASGFFTGVVIYIRSLPVLFAKLKILSRIAFFVSIALIIDSIRYRDWQDAAKAALMFMAGALIGATGDTDLNIVGGLISGGTGLWEMLNPSKGVLSRTVGYLPEALWHIAKIILMFLVFIADIGLAGGLVEGL